MHVVVTPLPRRSYLARFHPRAELPYDRLTVISELAQGRKLFIQGWQGAPLKVSQWHALRRAHFPRARGVGWNRMDLRTGKPRRVIIPLRGPK